MPVLLHKHAITAIVELANEIYGTTLRNNGVGSHLSAGSGGAIRLGGRALRIYCTLDSNSGLHPCTPFIFRISRRRKLDVHKQTP
jgi:hypothetical protein